MITSSHDDLSGTVRDALDLRRGALVNVIGYGARLPHPVLLAIATQLYGASKWGIYVAGQAAAYIVIRVCLMGLDRAMVYWVPKALAEGRLSGCRTVMHQVAVSSLAATGFSLVIGVPLLGDLWQLTDLSPLRIMSLALLPLALTELLINTTIGRRRMEAQAIIRDAIVPLVMVGSAIGFYYLGGHENGLAWAFLLSHCMGALCASWAFRRVFRDIEIPRDATWRLPHDLQQYARPMWGAELSNCLFIRLDPIILAIFVEPFIVGIYGIVLIFGNTVRSIRGSFDSLVTAIVSDMSAGGQHTSGLCQRLTHGFSYATSLVIVTQLPVIAFFLTFHVWLLPLFGDGFDRGGAAVELLCMFWGLNALAGLAGNVVNGVGGSRATLIASLVALALEVVLLLTLVPWWGLEGAACAVGTAVLARGLLQLVQMRRLTGTYAYTARVGWALLGALFSLLGMILIREMLVGQGDTLARVVSFSAFLIPFALLTKWTWAKPDFTVRPQAEPEVESS